MKQVSQLRPLATVWIAIDLHSAVDPAQFKATADRQTRNEEGEMIPRRVDIGCGIKRVLWVGWERFTFSLILFS